MTRFRALLLAFVIAFVGLTVLVGFVIAFDLVFIVGLATIVFLAVQKLAERKRLKRRHQAGGMIGQEVRLPYGETESEKRMRSLLNHMGSFDGFQMAYVGECVADQQGHETVPVSWRITTDARLAKKAREKILREYPDAFVSEIEDVITAKLIETYLARHPYQTVPEIIAEKWGEIKEWHEQRQHAKGELSQDEVVALVRRDRQADRSGAIGE